MTSRALDHPWDTEAAGAAATSHLGDPPAVDLGVGLVVLGGQAGPAGQLRGPGEPADVTDLGDEHRAQGGAHPGDGLHRGEAGVGAQPGGDQPGEGVDLELARVDQPQRRVHLRAHRRRQRDPVEPGPPAGAEQIAAGHRHPGAGEYRVDLAFEVGAQPHQLGPMAHQLAQLPALRRRDPGLGQPTHPQQVGEIPGVAFVVLDPPIRESLDPQRMRKMHRRTQLGQGVRGPVPPVAGLEHHLRGVPGAGHHRPQVLRIVADPGGLQQLAVLGHPHQHRPAPM